MHRRIKESKTIALHKAKVRFDIQTLQKRSYKRKPAIWNLPPATINLFRDKMFCFPKHKYPGLGVFVLFPDMIMQIFFL